MLSFNNKLPFLLSLFIFNFNIPVTLLAAEISVNLERNPINLNESVQITFTAKTEPDAEPDFSPLEKDFTILHRAQQQSTQIINWKKTRTIEWVVTVMPKRSGNLVIPAIHFGKDNSQFSSIIVNKAEATSTANAELFLQVEVNNARPYIQEQIIYTLKLYRKVNIAQASLTEPTLANAVIEKLGEDKTYNTQHKGENYAVTERKYAIFAKKSGSVSIAPLTLTADVILANQRRSNSFFSQQSTRTKRVVSEQINLDVQPKPAAADNHGWLPAEQVSLHEKWSTTLDKSVVGEPITRTLTLFAEGATIGALPELSAANMPEHLKAYPDQPILKEEARDNGMIALREEKIAFIPNKAGRYTLPAIEVFWWNTNTQQMESARIAEQTITAVAATGSTEKQNQPAPPLTSAPILTAPVENKRIDEQQDKGLWLWLTVFFATAWVSTLVYFLLRKPRMGKIRQAELTAKKEDAADKMLKQACTNDNPIMAKDALLQWGREHFKQSSLNHIAQHCDKQLQNEILSLNAVLYSKTKETWQGNALWQAFQNNKSTNTEKKEHLDPLQPLFKI